MKIRSLLLIPLLFAALSVRADEPPADLQMRAKKGDAETLTRLGILYLEGCGVEPNDKKAVKYLQRAAKLGDAEAQFLMGDCLMNGRGIQSNCPAAVASYRQAAEQGHRDAQRTMAFLFTQGLGLRKNPKKAMLWQLRSEGLDEAEIETRLAEAFPDMANNITQAKFQGGTLQDFSLWVARTIRYPDEAVQYNIKGQVVAQFVIDKEGRLTEVRILESPHELLSKAVDAALRRSPRWTPATEDGAPVRIRYTVPVYFN